ncbi:hypothetical protein [uncultured Modestobacter sp.]|nr:hypothetical protein [uncultured Modestobacter sp.]
MSEISDRRWALIESLMPSANGRAMLYRAHRQVVEGVLYRCGMAW